MSESMSTTLWSKKNLLGLVYVGIAIGLLANGVYFSQANGQWLKAAGQLDPKVQTVSFDLRGTMPVAIIKASLENPTGGGGIELLLVTYQVFVNSTRSPFFVQGSSEVADVNVNYAKLIPPSSSTNITSAVPIISDTVAPLTRFLENYNTSLRTFVGIILQLRSSYISIVVPSCIELPGQIPTLCPSLRSQTGGGGGA